MNYAYCYRSGEIEFGTSIPDGALPVGHGGSAEKLRDIVEFNARHAYDGTTLLVPGIPEAETDNEANDAYRYFRELVGLRLAGKPGWPTPYAHANRLPA